MSDFGVPRMNSGLKQRIGLAAIELVLVVVVMWYVLGHRDRVFIGSVAAAIVTSTLAPPRWSGLVSGVCLLGLAAFFRLQYGMTQLPLVLGIFGVFVLITGVQRAKGG